MDWNLPKSARWSAVSLCFHAWAGLSLVACQGNSGLRWEPSQELSDGRRTRLYQFELGPAVRITAEDLDGRWLELEFDLGGETPFVLSGLQPAITDGTKPLWSLGLTAEGTAAEFRFMPLPGVHLTRRLERLPWANSKSLGVLTEAHIEGGSPGELSAADLARLQDGFRWNLDPSAPGELWIGSRLALGSDGEPEWLGGEAQLFDQPRSPLTALVATAEGSPLAFSRRYLWPEADGMPHLAARWTLGGKSLELWTDAGVLEVAIEGGAAPSLSLLPLAEAVIDGPQPEAEAEAVESSPGAPRSIWLLR